MAPRSKKAALADVLDDLSEENFKRFCHDLMDLRAGPRIRRKAVEGKSRLEVADMMVSTFTEAKVVGVAEEILRAMGCTQEADDLVNETGGPSPKPGGDKKHFVDKQGPSWSQRVDQMVFVIELLLETMGDLSDKELEKFQQLFHYHPPSFIYTWSLTLTEEIDLHDTVFLMVKTYGQESVRKTKHILGRMKRTDLTQRLSDITSGPKKKLTVDEHLSALFHKFVPQMCSNDCNTKNITATSWTRCRKTGPNQDATTTMFNGCDNILVLECSISLYANRTLLI